MSIGFIIMQIGNQELDRMCGEAIVPALVEAGLEPKRVDKHTEGQLLKSEIIRFITDADIIVADLTNERPNCYLEIGYAMGLGKFRNLILTVKEDHFATSSNYDRDGGRIHFDLSGYDIVSWDPARLDLFREALAKRIKRRKAVMDASAEPATVPSPWNDTWLAERVVMARNAYSQSLHGGFTEVQFTVADDFSQKAGQELVDAARQSQIDTHGWPIGVYLERPEFRPVARKFGIEASVWEEGHKSYDYWALAFGGDFYSLISLYEDRNQPGAIYFNTRVMKTAEALLFCQEIYSRLGLPETARIHIGIGYTGLRGRVLTSDKPGSGRVLSDPCAEDEHYSEISTSLTELSLDLVGPVQALVAPLFSLFSFYVLPDIAYERIVTRFQEGQLS